MNLLPLDLLPLISIIILLGLAMHRNHFLMILLFLETAILTLTLSLFMTTKSLFLILSLLTFAACEAALGLSCLVKLTHSYGTDMIKSLSANKW